MTYCRQAELAYAANIKMKGFRQPGHFQALRWCGLVNDVCKELRKYFNVLDAEWIWIC